jgi:long-subunit acyl-CoA synthetase (AMP-forming)
MNLTAQRNISIELFEAGPENVVLVGTMLDNEHLIKLEVNVYLPDEQITRSNLSMIRVPFPVCREVEAVGERLVGLRIERGVLSEIGRRVGGSVGCSHIKELAANIVYFVASHLVGRHAGVDPLSYDYSQRTPEGWFSLTKDLLRDSCLAYCQTTPLALDEQIGIRRVGGEHKHPTPVGEYEPSFGILLRDRAQRYGDRTYFRYRVGDRDFAVSFNEFAKKSSQIARHLIAQGIGRGDRVCMLSENRYEMFLFEMALFSIGAVTVPVFAGYHPPQIEYVLNHAKPRYVVVSGLHQLEKIERHRHPGIERYYCMDHDDACAERDGVDFAGLLKRGGASAKELNPRVDAVGPDDLCMIMYTSGTTGPPKGVRLTHRNLISQQKSMSLMWDVDEHDVFLCYLPWHHSFGGLFERFMTLFNGAELCLDDSRGRDIDRLVENWRAFKPTIFLSVPRVHGALVTKCREDAAISKLVFKGRLRFVFTAGAPLPAQIEAAYRAHSITVLEGWGLTEASPCVTATTKEGTWQSGYVGVPLPGVTVRIDADQEILVKGPNVMGGYLDDEDATFRVLDSDGWLRTGDLGEFTKDGLRILGRRDGAFKLTTGEKVHPQRIENVLVDESLYVALALVLGSGEDFVGALIHPDFARLRAWAIENDQDPECLPDNPAVYELYARELERINPMIEIKYQRIKRVVLADREPSLERGELTPSGKIVRKTVMNNFKGKLDALFAAKTPEGVIEVRERELQRT